MCDNNNIIYRRASERFADCACAFALEMLCSIKLAAGIVMPLMTYGSTLKHKCQYSLLLTLVLECTWLLVI